MIAILTNFGAGFGPFVRALDLAREIRSELRKKLREQIVVVVPWVYGDAQKRIIEEEVTNNTELINSIYLSKDLGDCLKPLLFNGNHFNKTLEAIVNQFEKQKQKLNSLLKSTLQVVNLVGEVKMLAGSSIRLEVSRNPVISTPIECAYYTSIGYFTEILQQLLIEQELGTIDYSLIEKTLPTVQKLETDFRIHFQPKINSLSFKQDRSSLFPSEVTTPPLLRKPAHCSLSIDKGIYISLSGISGLNILYEEAMQLQVRKYANYNYDGLTPDCILPPSVISHHSITGIFARAAWNTIWLSNLTQTPLICPEYTEGDNPEIFFNLKTIQKYELAYTWRRKETSLLDIINSVAKGKEKTMKNIYRDMKEQFGTLDGIEFCSKRISEDFLEAHA